MDYRWRYIQNRIGSTPDQTADLKRALTHDSFLPDGDSGSSGGNNRLITLGQFYFRGLVCKMLFDFWPGTGQRLQHTLGNLFSNRRLHELFDKLRLGDVVRAGDSFDIGKHRHLFVYGLCGFVAKYLPEEAQRQFIIRYFMPEDSSGQLAGTYTSYSAQLDLLCRQKFDIKPRYLITQEENRRFRVDIYGADTLLSSHASRSLHYARVKAVHRALSNMATVDQTNLDHDEEWQFRMQERSKREEQDRKETTRQKHEKYLEEQQSRRVLRINRLMELRRQRQENDLRRRKAKKMRKEEMERRAKVQAAKASMPMSANKRRHLEDKQK